MLKLVRASRCYILQEIQVSIRSFITEPRSYLSLFQSAYSRFQIFFFAQQNLSGKLWESRITYIQISTALFLTLPICYLLFPHHSESAAIKSAWWWDLALFDRVYQPTSDRDAFKWHVLPPGCFSAWSISPASLTLRLLQGTGFSAIL